MLYRYVPVYIPVLVDSTDDYALYYVTVNVPEYTFFKRACVSGLGWWVGGWLILNLKHFKHTHTHTDTHKTSTTTHPLSSNILFMSLLSLVR